MVKTNQFEAKTFGVGELISQRKLFRVPIHQRSYAWDREAVESFVSDIELAITNKAADYFIGLVVIQSSDNGEWILLDGQQRLTTVSIVFSAIKQSLIEQGLNADADQIQQEYLAVRRLGGSISSRMLLNEENQALFHRVVIDDLDSSQLLAEVDSQAKFGSNKNLLNAVITCRDWIKQFCSKGNKGSEDAIATRLYDLARFLDSKVRVVAVEVTSDVDAYILFESLNDRGVALSAFDLLKNYIFSKSDLKYEIWSLLMDLLTEESPDDFLKTFWTSRNGVIQKSQIFRQLKTTYSDGDAIKTLMYQLLEDATLLSAIKDDDHVYWQEQSKVIRDQVFLLKTLESKQARAVVIAILRDIKNDSVKEHYLNLIVNAIVRFQLIFKGRTGIVEKVFGRLCQIISKEKNEEIQKRSFESSIKELDVSPSQFIESFFAYEDKKYSRIAYLLSALELTEKSGLIGHQASEVREVFERSSIKQTFKFSQLTIPEYFSKIGNYALIEHSETFSYLDYEQPDDFVETRTNRLANLADQIWKI